MSKIRILPEILSNKIAAGEVVERPSSVVKELLENAIDAGSTRIGIDVEKGGRSLLRVSDNGSGMQRDDALLAIERYATSKICGDEDLFSIQTLGFRGEALPSIASVSRFILNTRSGVSGSGTEIRIDGGKIKEVLETGAPRGTVITVRDIFYNVPARRKFLKTVNTEMSHIADTVASIALGWPAIQFKLHHNGRILKSWPGASRAIERVIDVLGTDLRQDLHAIECRNDCLSLSGWITSPQVCRSTSQKIFVYVNGRFVRDRIVQQALLEGYRGRLMKGRYPLAVLFMQVPFDRLDVNVHPTKHEVRFADRQQICTALKETVAQALRHAERRKWRLPEEAEAVETGTDVKPSTVSNGDRAATPRRVAGEERIQETLAIWERGAATPQKTIAPKGSAIPSRVTEALKEEAPSPAASLKETPVAIDSGQALSPAEETGEPPELWAKTFFADLKVIGQLHDTYILCASREGLVLIDQHAAHERVLYEHLRKKSGGAFESAQRLLLPETVDLGYREADALQKLIPELEMLGLKIEPFGGNTVVVKSVPALLAERPIQPLVTKMAEKMVAGGLAPGLSEVLEECLILMACHGAIRAHQPLSEKQMTALLGQLDGCRNASHCPHGRPIWVHWDMTTLAKAFGRMG